MSKKTTATQEEVARAKKLISNLVSNVPWIQARKILILAGLDPVQGIVQTKQSLFSSLEKDPDVVVKALTLRPLLIEAITGGEMLVAFFKLSMAKQKALQTALQKSLIPAKSKDNPYPFQLTEKDISDDDLNVTRLVAIEDSAQGTCYVFATARRHYETKELSRVVLTESAKREYPDLDRIRGYEENKKLYYDCLCVQPNSKFIEIRMDMSGGMNVTDREANSRRFLECLCDFSSELKSIDFLKDHINLFPLIDEIYEDKKDGDVISLDFVLQSGFTRKEQRKKGQTDLRSEKYHSAGKRAVGNVINPYRVKTQYKVKMSKVVVSRPELLLPGNYNMFRDTKRPLPHLYILRAMGRIDSELVLNKVRKRLSS